MPFSLSELIPMSLALCESCIGIIELAHPDAKLSINEDYRQALLKSGIKHHKLAAELEDKETKLWAGLFKPSQIYRTHNAVFTRRPLGSLQSLTKTSYDDDGPPLANRDVRNLVILTELPFVVCFAERVKIVQRLIMSDKEDNQGEMTNFIIGPAINVVIRRNYIYEDAFEKLSSENGNDFKSTLFDQKEKYQRK
ncbi:hypothetical protein SNE40_018304 [Patella caerulea]|uniref:HECT-type E3 ubiquitin transferase n=1 Tax=Patella caerulea TaxID=87958 RepID=A0AAN8J8H7_PATCE